MLTPRRTEGLSPELKVCTSAKPLRQRFIGIPGMSSRDGDGTRKKQADSQIEKALSSCKKSESPAFSGETGKNFAPPLNRLPGSLSTGILRKLWATFWISVSSMAPRLER
jgi:hypothetical protein